MNGLVYPAAARPGHSLGVHLTKTTWGTVLLGPTIRYQEARTTTRATACRSRRSSNRRGRCCRRSRWRICSPAAPASAPSCAPDQPFADFLIERDTVNPRVVQVAGIDSPGLTSSLAIGARVAAIWKKSE